MKFLDFGLAKFAGDSEEFNRAEALDTIPGMVVGTLAYYVRFGTAESR